MTRRAFLTASVAAAGSASATVAGSTGAAGAATAARARTGVQATTYRFGGEVQGWQGRAPQSISGQQNPTVQLQAGQQYRFFWENLDGQPHNIALHDAEGNALERTEVVREEGATQTLTFTATPAMARYICEVHPTTMVGDVQVAGGGGAGGEQGDGGDPGTSVPTSAYFLAGAVLLAFVSPILFALVLLFVGTGDSLEDGAGRSGR